MPRANTTSTDVPAIVQNFRLLVYAATVVTIGCLTWYLNSLCCPEFSGLRPWIELLNGATWPSDNDWLTANCARWPFDLILALKIVVTLGAMIAVVAIPTEYFLRKKRQTMTAQQMLRSQGRAAVEAVQMAFANSPTERETAVMAVRKALDYWENSHKKIFPSDDLDQTLSD